MTSRGENLPEEYDLIAHAASNELKNPRAQPEPVGQKGLVFKKTYYFSIFVLLFILIVFNKIWHFLLKIKIFFTIKIIFKNLLTLSGLTVNNFYIWYIKTKIIFVHFLEIFN